MQDRVSLNPGRVLITPEDGSPAFYATMTRADNPTQEGDKLSKSTLFDAAAEKAVFDDETGNHTPAQAFVKLIQKIEPIEPIGTIKTTIRTDLGDKWLLCNGTGVDATSYSVLNEMLLQSQPIDGEWTHITDTPFTNASNIVYKNGYWIVCGQSSDTSYPYPYIWYSTDFRGPWTAVKIATAYQAVYDIDYCNGYWVVAVKTTKTSGYYTCGLYYSTSLDGTWTYYEAYHQNSYGTTPNLAVGNGYIVYIYGDVNSYTNILYTTTPAGSWKGKQISTSIQGKGIQFVDGKFYIVGNSATIFYAASPADTWTKVQISTATGYILSNIVKVKDTFVILATNGSYTAGPTRIFYSKDTTLTNWSYTNVAEGSAGSIVVVNDNYVIVSAAIPTGSVYNANFYMLEYDSLSSVRTIYTSNSSGSQSADFCGAVVVKVGNTLYYLPHGLLPSISTDGVYHYIKAKE